MPSDTRIIYDAIATATISLGGLAAGSGRQSNGIDFAGALGLRVFCKFQTGTAPTAGGLFKVYLLPLDDDTSPLYGGDGATGADGAITIAETPLLGQFKVTNTANAFFKPPAFDTSRLGPLPPFGSFAVVNATDQAMHGTTNTTDNHVLAYQLYHLQTTT